MCNPGATGTARIPPASFMSGSDGMRKRHCVPIRRAHSARNWVSSDLPPGRVCRPLSPKAQPASIGRPGPPCSPRLRRQIATVFCSARLADSAYSKLHVEVAVSGIWAPMSPRGTERRWSRRKDPRRRCFRSRSGRDRAGRVGGIGSQGLDRGLRSSEYWEVSATVSHCPGWPEAGGDASGCSWCLGYAPGGGGRYAVWCRRLHRAAI